MATTTTMTTAVLATTTERPRVSATPRLDTARLVLAPRAAADLADLTAMWSDPIVYGMIGGRPQTREEIWHRLLRLIGHRIDGRRRLVDDPRARIVVRPSRR